MFIVIYRPHNELKCNTQHIGPFPTHAAACDYLSTLPALGILEFDENNVVQNSGVKYVEELRAP